MLVFPNHQNEFNQFRNDDHRAFEFFFNYYGRAIYRYLSWRCGNEHSARDLAGDVFHKAWKQRHTLQNEDHLVGFLFVTAFELCISNRRADTGGRETEASAAISVQDAHRFLQDPEVLRARRLSAMNRALDNLPRQQRNVLRKLYLEAKEVPMVAMELKIVPQTVRNTRNKAVHAMEQRLSGLEFMLVAMGLLLSRIERQ
jgi:RNA polymerase sigma factor (sigma-70 family)